LAIYEMRYVEDVPAGAAINEAVELAKTYDSPEAASFINGILGTVSRTIAE
ncbi:MAG: antitermination protein NusB, partial [Butyricicoccus sp.]|nr:antitermination protein NusB [Butyricicoccus sp.]